MGKKTKFIHIQDNESLYSDIEMINTFFHDIILFNIDLERLIMEPYSMEERNNIDTLGESTSLYFYVHVPIIYDLRVLFPFNLLKLGFWQPSTLPLLRTLQMCVTYSEISNLL